MLTWKKIMGWLVLSVLTTGLIVGCSLSASNDSGESPAGGSSPSLSVSDCRVIKHDAGETEVCGQLQKVAVLSVHTLDLLLSLDMQPAGYAPPLNTYRGEVFDNPAQQIPYLGDRTTTQPVNLGGSGEPSLEKLAALKPDLIVGEAGRNAKNYDLLSQIAPTLLWRNRTAKGQWRNSLRKIAATLGRDEKAEVVIQQYETLIADVRADLADVVAAHPTMLLLGANQLDEGIYAISADSYLGELLGGLGFQLIPEASSDDNPNAPISIETLPSLDDADTIIILGYNLNVSDQALENLSQAADKSLSDWLETHQVQTIKQSWKANAIAQSLTASQENRVYFATYYKWNGLNGPIGAELILKQLRQFLLND